MSEGPGKYDAACTAARLATSAEMAILIVLNGHLGSGFSVQAQGEAKVQLLPSLLREVAAQIERDLRAPSQ